MQYRLQQTLFLQYLFLAWLQIRLRHCRILQFVIFSEYQLVAYRHRVPHMHVVLSPLILSLPSRIRSQCVIGCRQSRDMTLSWRRWRQQQQQLLILTMTNENLIPKPCVHCDSDSAITCIVAMLAFFNYSKVPDSKNYVCTQSVQLIGLSLTYNFSVNSQCRLCSMSYQELGFDLSNFAIVQGRLIFTKLVDSWLSIVSNRNAKYLPAKRRVKLIFRIAVMEKTALMLNISKMIRDTCRTRMDFRLTLFTLAVHRWRWSILGVIALDSIGQIHVPYNAFLVAGMKCFQCSENKLLI